MADEAARRGASDDTLVMVPLVFDDEGFLYSPQSFNALSDSLLEIQRAGGSFEEPEVLFTDLGTFKDALAGDQTLEDLYAEGKRGSLLLRADDPNPPQYAEVYDPYVSTDLEPPPCEWDAFGDCETGGGGGGGYAPPTPRPDYNVAPEYGTTPDGPEMWRGDVISGDTDNGSGSSGSGNLGHSAIVTELDSGEDGDGDFMNYDTQVMEAIGDRPNPADEVVEREARQYWIDDGYTVNHVKVRYHWHTSFDKRNHAIAYARAQDPDPYSALSAKWTEGKWYCSKLVWKAYNEATGDDLDPNWGYWVMPEDLENSGHLRTVYHFIHS